MSGYRPLIHRCWCGARFLGEQGLAWHTQAAHPTTPPTVRVVVEVYAPGMCAL